MRPKIGLLLGGLGPFGGIERAVGDDAIDEIAGLLQR
jgi:hypothetical protein